MADFDSQLGAVVQAVQDGMCLPFLGAGASAGYECNGHSRPGVPLGSQFIDLFNQACGLTNGNAINDFCLAAEYLVFLKSGSRAKLESIIASEVAKISEPRPIHTALASVRTIRFAITTNYDSLLERAAQDARRRLTVHVHDPEDARTALFRARPTYEPADLVVHKMHGTVEKPATMLATRSDYIRYLSNLSDPNRGMPEFFRKFVIPTHTLLFLGYSLRDWNFLVIWEGVLAMYHAAQSEIQAYAVMKDYTDFDEDYLRGKGIRLIRSDLVTFARKFSTALNVEIPQLRANGDTSGDSR